ncbi:MAG: caspase family protein [Bacteroidales bacterium]|nr:caspase family protein [Bacteroidales bacterium]
MKRLIAFSLLFLVWISHLSAQDFKKFAVVVGCADYQHANMDLRYSDDDAYRFYAYLKSPEGGALPDEHIAVLVDEAATKNNILKTMNEVFSRASANDMLIFYFSGHGSEGAFCPSDVTDQYSSLLLHSEVKAIFKKYPASYKICLADACYSGSIYQGSPSSSSNAASGSETNVVIIMSSKPTETSQENPMIRQGAFTYYLLKGLKGSADRNNDNIISLKELFPYVKGNVLNFTANKQTPVIEGNASRYMPIGILK